MTTVVLIFLMAAIGLGIGLDEEIINNFLKIGFQCIVISLLAIGCSVLCISLREDSASIEEVGQGIESRKPGHDGSVSERTPRGREKGWLFLGLDYARRLACRFAGRDAVTAGAGSGMGGSLFRRILDRFIYLCGGSLRANRSVFRFIRKLGFRILWLSLAIIVGSLSGGFIAGLILDVPMKVPLLAAGGMSFYSVTGAYMTEAFGLQMGTYGFIVNVLREFFTILLMPLLVRISLGSPIAGGAAGNMDTMLAPVTKFVGIRLGLVTLITGTILTFVVPFLLPLLYRVMTI